jgi:hypothetical protein
VVGWRGEVVTNRYDGKPLLRLLELYVVWAVGALSEADDARLTQMASKLAQTFGGDGSWQSAVAASIAMPAEMPDLIRGMWAKNSEIAATNGVELPAQQFAEIFVDNNFAP